MDDSIDQAQSQTRNLVKSTIIALLLFLILGINWAFVQSAFGELLDFGSFMASGIAAADGQNPYANNSPLILVVTFKWIKELVSSPNLNPPITVLIFESISRFAPHEAVNFWRILSVTLYLLSLTILVWTYPYSRTPFRITWAICLAGFWHTIQLGQIYIPLLLALVVFWILSQKGYLKLAGVALGILVSIKPNFIYLAILIGISGYFSTLLVAGVTTIAVSSVPLAVYGLKIYQQWVVAVNGYQEAGLLIPGNSSLQGITLHFGATQPGMILGIVLGILGIYFSFYNRQKFVDILSIGIILSLLASPIAWTGYTIFALPIFLTKEKWSGIAYISAGLFIIPYWIVLALSSISEAAFHFFGWIYGLGLLFLLAGSFIKKDDLPPILLTS